MSTSKPPSTERRGIEVADFEDLKLRLREFAEFRNWQKLHDPKNLAMAIASEAGELLAELRWLNTDESAPSNLSIEQVAAIADEMADVLIFLVRMADVMNVDLVDAALAKTQRNKARFPASRQGAK